MAGTREQSTLWLQASVLYKITTFQGIQAFCSGTKLSESKLAIYLRIHILLSEIITHLWAQIYRTILL